MFGHNETSPSLCPKWKFAGFGHNDLTDEDAHVMVDACKTLSDARKSYKN